MVARIHFYFKIALEVLHDGSSFILPLAETLLNCMSLAEGSVLLLDSVCRPPTPNAG